MGIAEESTDKIISVSFRAVSVTTDIILQALKALREALSSKNKNKSSFMSNDNKEVKVKTGKMKLSELSGKGITDSVDVSNKREFKKLEKLCKKYNIDYSVMTTKGEEKGQKNYTIFFKTNDTNIIKKMLDEAIKQEERRVQKKEKKQERREERKQNRHQDPVNTNEKKRESMGAEEREKEEPIKTPSPDKEMPVKSNEPASKTTDDVQKDKKREEAAKEGDSSRDSINDIKSDDINRMSTSEIWAEVEKEAQASARESKLRAMALNESTPRFTLPSLIADLYKKKQAEKDNPNIPKVQKDRSHDSLEI